MPLTFLNFEKTFEKIFFYEKNPRIAAGVSGGPDSLALVILLNQWINKKKGKLIALVVDHGIRKESLSESLQTKKYLFNKNIVCKIFSVAKNKVKDGKLNQARINRFEILLNYCITLNQCIPNICECNRECDCKYFLVYHMQTIFCSFLYLL